MILYRGQKVNADWPVMYFRIAKDKKLLKWFSSFRILIEICVDIWLYYTVPIHFPTQHWPFIFIFENFTLENITLKKITLEKITRKKYPHKIILEKSTHIRFVNRIPPIRISFRKSYVFARYFYLSFSHLNFIRMFQF